MADIFTKEGLASLTASKLAAPTRLTVVAPKLNNSAAVVDGNIVDVSKYGVVLPEVEITDTRLGNATAGMPLASMGWIIGGVLLLVVAYFLHKKYGKK